MTNIRAIFQKTVGQFAKGVAVQVVCRGESADFQAFRPCGGQTISEGHTANYSTVGMFPILVVGSEDEDGFEAV